MSFWIGNRRSWARGPLWPNWDKLVRRCLWFCCLILKWYFVMRVLLIIFEMLYLCIIVWIWVELVSNVWWYVYVYFYICVKWFEIGLCCFWKYWCLRTSWLPLEIWLPSRILMYSDNSVAFRNIAPRVSGTPEPCGTRWEGVKEDGLGLFISYFSIWMGMGLILMIF